MTKNIKRLYTNSKTQTVLNNKISRQIEIKTGIKQGYALSMVLYILCIEDLIQKVKANENIDGYKIANLTFKISGYADDIVGYVTNNNSIEHFFNEFEKWGKFSGARVNKKKTDPSYFFNGFFTVYTG